MDERLLSEKLFDQGNAISGQSKGATAVWPAPVEPPHDPVGYEPLKAGKMFAQPDVQRLRGSTAVPLFQLEAVRPVSTLP